MVDRPLISLTMIVKNEEANIARALESARGIADELVVVDTGSTDRTVEIARAHGAQVHFFEWIGDFSAARNTAIEHATGDWILILDGDDVAVESSPGALRAEVAAFPPSVLFVRVPVRSPRADGGGSHVVSSRRLFRRCPEIRWQHPVHETLVHAALDNAAEAEVGSRALTIEHHGYAQSVEQLRATKVARNRRILKDAIGREPENPNWYLYLAREHSNAGHDPSALKLVRRALHRFRGQLRPDFEGALRVLGMRVAMKMKQPEVAVKLGTPAVTSYAYSELCYVLGLAFYQLGDQPQAERFLRLAIRLRGRAAEYQSDAGAGSWKPMIQLALIAWESGQSGLAMERWRSAHEWAPEEALTNLALGRGLVATGSPVEGEALVRRAIELAPTMEQAHVALVEALVAQGRVQEAYDHVEPLTRAEPSVAAYWLSTADVLRSAGEHAACVELLGRAIAHHPREADMYERLGQSAQQIGRLEDAMNAFQLAAAC